MRAGLAGALLLAATAAAAPTPRGAPPAHARTAAATAPRRAGAAAAPRPPPEECCWCDEDTPAMERTMTDSEGHALDLVFSDEFSTPGRDFSNGKDKRWTALDKGDDTNDSPMYYHPQAVTTVRDEGAMVRVDPHNESVPERTYRKYPDPVHALQIISTNISDTPLANRTGKQFAGGMVQSWNKFCFTGGAIEISAKFPQGAGFWPALWLFGNLGRAIYEESNDGLWPYSLTECDSAWESMPKEQSKDFAPQRISGCNATPGEGLHPYQGRGATEIDIVEIGDSPEGAGGWMIHSVQAAPPLPKYFRPETGKFPPGWRQDPETKRFEYEPPKYSKAASWYRGLRFGGNSSGHSPVFGPNPNWHGPEGMADAISGGVCNLNDLSERYRKFRLEWREGDGGYVRWFIDDEFAFEIPAEALGRYTVCGQAPDDKNGFRCEHVPRRTMPAEPMSIVINTALGSWNGGAAAASGKFPGKMYVDYVRVYQRPDRLNIGCDPPDFPTKAYIDAHPELYGEPALPPGERSCPAFHPPPTRGLGGRADAAPAAADGPLRTPDVPAAEQAAAGGGAEGGRPRWLRGAPARTLLTAGACATVVLGAALAGLAVRRAAARAARRARGGAPPDADGGMRAPILLAADAVDGGGAARAAAAGGPAPQWPAAVQNDGRAVGA